MSDKKYFSRPVKEYLDDDNLLEKDRRDAIFQDPDDNGRKINEQFLEAKENLIKIKEWKRSGEDYMRTFKAGVVNISRVIGNRKIRKNTFSRWLGLLPISLLVLVTNEVGIRVAAKEAENVKTIQLTDDGIDLAKYASAMTILGMLVMLYVKIRNEEEEKEFQEACIRNKNKRFLAPLFEIPDPVFDGLLKYVYGNINKSHIRVSDTLFHKFHIFNLEESYDPEDSDIDEFIASIKDYQTMYSRVIDLEPQTISAYYEIRAHMANDDDFYARVLSVCAIVIGSMSDKDILKLVNLLGKDKSVDKANAMLTKFIDSDILLKELVKSVFNGNTDTSLLGPISDIRNKGRGAVKHRLAHNKQSDR